MKEGKEGKGGGERGRGKGEGKGGGEKGEIVDGQKRVDLAKSAFFPSFIVVFGPNGWVKKGQFGNIRLCADPHKGHPFRCFVLDLFGAYFR